MGLEPMTCAMKVLEVSLQITTITREQYVEYLV